MAGARAGAIEFWVGFKSLTQTVDLTFPSQYLLSVRLLTYSAVIVIVIFTVILIYLFVHSAENPNLNRKFSEKR